MGDFAVGKKGVAFEFYIGLYTQADTKLLKSNPMIAAGDFQVSVDGGAFANLATLPAVTPASGYGVRVQLSAAEMNGDNILVVWHDAAGAEWCDGWTLIQPSTNSLSGYQALNAQAADWTSVRAAFLDAAISSRAIAGDAMTLTGAYDAAKTAAPASTALSTAQWTSIRAALLDNLAWLTSGNVNVLSPTLYEDRLVIVARDSYTYAEGRALEFSVGANCWPTDLNGYTVTLYAGPITKTGTVVTPTGTSRKVRFELSTSDTTVTAGENYRFQVVATKTGEKATLRKGKCIIEAV